MKHPYAYMRCSGMGQDDGDTWDRQSSKIARFQEERGFPAVCFYREPGVCGALEDRPILAQMMLDIEENGTELVIVEKLDRLARDLMTQENILRDLRRRGCELISVEEPDLCSDDPSRTVIRQIIGAIAEYDRKMIVSRTRAARERIRGRGIRCEGRKPFGFHPDKPFEADVLAKIREMAEAGLTFARIAGKLNSAKIPPRHGAFWFPATVARIVKRQTA